LGDLFRVRDVVLIAVDEARLGSWSSEQCPDRDEEADEEADEE